MKRNLYYFVCPLRDAWRWNIDRLLSFWDIFSGKKLVSIVEGPGLEKPEKVMERFGPDVEFMVSENCPVLCETKTFIRGLERLQSQDPKEITFYAHAKGVRHEGEDLVKVKRWADSMYVLNLSSPELVDRLMLRYHALGCYRQDYPYGGSQWHYSGTFYWLKHRELFSRNWTDIEPLKFGSEGYPGRHFKLEESFSLTPPVLPHILYGNPPGEETVREWLGRLLREHGISSESEL